MRQRVFQLSLIHRIDIAVCSFHTGKPASRNKVPYVKNPTAHWYLLNCLIAKWINC